MSNTFRYAIRLRWIKLSLSIIIVLCTLPLHADSIPATTFASKNFWQLTKALTFYQNAAKEPWVPLPDYPAILKVGTKSTSVPLLREHLKLIGDLSTTDVHTGRRFDADLAIAVAIFQARHGLKIDGVVGKDTREQLNVPADVRVKQIALNLQRWSDLAAKVNDRFIIVNIPDFHMFLYEQNKLVLSLRAIVGKRDDLQTPELSSKINRIVFNPYWNIPTKIVKNDIIPKVLTDPNYLYRMHIRAFSHIDDDASEINRNRINWQAALEKGPFFQLRQDPGPENALGLVKFEFQNSHDVYMHDTSAKNLFDNDIRDYSHGCIRLENPFALVEYLMKDNPEWTEERIKEVLDSGKTKYVRVKHPIPIFVTYITAWVDKNGRVNFRNDLYQLDEGILSTASLSTKEPDDLQPLF